jgi:hypothetical protein
MIGPARVVGGAQATELEVREEGREIVLALSFSNIAIALRGKSRQTHLESILLINALSCGSRTE